MYCINHMNDVMWIKTGISFKLKHLKYKHPRTHNRINQLFSKGIWQLHKPHTRTHHKPNVCIYFQPVVPKQAISPAVPGLRSYAFNTPSCSHHIQNALITAAILTEHPPHPPNE